MEKIKEYLYSPKGMSIINALFLVTVVVGNGWLTSITYVIWLIYLVYGIKTTTSKVVRVIYVLFALFALFCIGGFIVSRFVGPIVLTWA